MKLTNIAVAVSGGGRSLANFLSIEMSGESRYHVCCVITSNPACKAVTIAEKADFPVFCHSFPKVPEPTLISELEAFLQKLSVKWIVLAGFLRPLPIMTPWRSKIVNIHPALLPKFGGQGMFGKHVHRAVLAAGEIESGASVHFVNETYDDGAVIAQARVPVKQGDDEEKLAERVFSAECQLYPKVMNMLIEGRLPMKRGEIFQMEN